MVDDLIHLLTQFGVNFRDHSIDQGFFYWLVAVVRLEQFFDKRSDSTLGNLLSIIIRAQPGFCDDLIKDSVLKFADSTLLHSFAGHTLIP